MSSLTRWSPFRDMEEFFDRFSRPFGVDRPARGSEGSQEIMTIADWSPTVDISENDDEYLIKVELPEVRRDAEAKPKAVEIDID